MDHTSSQPQKTSSSPKKKIKKISDAHSGSWYEDNPKRLGLQFSQWLASAIKTPKTEISSQTDIKNTKAIIVPHAGYYYCGKTAAYSWKNFKVGKNIKNIFILGPSHFYSIPQGAHLPVADFYSTPFGDLPINKEIISEMFKLPVFGQATIDDFETEHSVEMMLPFLAHILIKQGYELGDSSSCPSIIPMIVGSGNPKLHLQMAQALVPWLDNDSSLFVLSSDFCHWGKRYGYMPYDSSKGKIYEYITHLDSTGMKAISSMEMGQFRNYIAKTSNSICGQNPILIFMEMAKLSKKFQFQCDFIDYSQSNQVLEPSEFSVSYASGVFSFSEL